MRYYTWVLLLLFPLSNLCAQKEEVQKVTLKGIMILASDEAGAKDKRLQRFESRLRSLFKFNSYRHYGEGKATIKLPGKSSFPLGKGHQMEVEAEPMGGNKVRAKVRWLKGSRNLIHTTLVMEKGVSTILGGPSQKEGEGNLIVVLLLN